MSRADRGPTSPRREYLPAAGLALVLVAAITRLLASFEPFPFWSTDPLLMATPTTGITPGLSLALDAASLLGTAMIAWSRGGPRWWEATLWSVGTAWAGLHAVVIEGGSLDNLVTGSMWATALAAGIAARSIAADSRLARLTAAALIGACVLLAGRGAIQVFIEHPETVRAYHENKAEFLAAQGWSEGSAMARSFERRLYQPEASGWFGLSNVYASVMTGSLIALLGLAVASIKRTNDDGAAPLGRRAVRILLIAGLAAACTGLALSRSKGGVAAAAAGVAALAVTMLPSPRLRRTGAVVAACLPLAALAAVLLRGLIGERIGELSLLFRWFYLQGAGRIFLESPLLGVGPADFKDAYLLAKPPLSPEEISSPHSVLFDFASTLGLGGVAWCLLLAFWMPALARAMARKDSFSESGPPVDRNQLRLLLGIVAGAVLVSAWLERATATLDMTLLRLGGIALWGGVAAAVMVAWGRWPGAARSALAAAGIAVATHAQIEVTPIWPGSAMWFWMLLGLASGSPTTPLRPRPVAASLFLAAFAGAGFMTPWTLRWEQNLSRASDSAHASVEVREDLARAEAAGPAARAELAARLSSRMGSAVPADAAALRSVCLSLILSNLEAASLQLERAVTGVSPHFATSRALSRVEIETSVLLDQLSRPEESASARSRAEAAIDRYLGRRPNSAAGWGWLGVLRSGLAGADLTKIRRACEAWERAAALDPYSLDYAPDLAESYRTLGETAKARDWARVALRNDELHRLDPLQRLTEAERSRLAGIAGEP